ncbi:MAG TPA: carboxypeptidase-like regulatory domain-containing protein, partial [Vicinamibacterales bacterium]
MRKLLLAILVIVVGLALATDQALAQERFGGLTGTVTDESGGVLPGTTVNITNKVTGQVRSVVTGSDGRYAILDLDPGRYAVRIELTGFTSVQADDINVLLGRTLEFDAQMKVGNLAETVTVTGEATPVIDLRTTTVAHNVTAEEFDRLPKARSFQSIAMTAPSVNSGELEGGFQVNGASGAENAFTVDGVVTNGLINGQSRQDTVFEYLQEVQVKTTGISAEYGGALGGVISAVTKSGGNVFHGEGHYYFFGSPLSAGPVQRLVLSPVDDISVSYVTDDKQRDNRNEFGGSVGGPLVKDRLFFFGSYSPRLVRRTNDYGYANGADPGSTDQDQNVTQAFGKLSYSQNRVQANGSILFTPTTSTGTLIAYSGTTPNSSTQTKLGNAPNTDRGFKSDQTNFSGNVDFWLTSASFVSVRGGYFY